MSTPERRRPPDPIRRDVVDHALARRALLRQVLGGGGLLSKTEEDEER